MEPLEAAVTVLEEEGTPLHWTVIQDLALRRGYLDPFADPQVGRKLRAALAAAAKEEGAVRRTGKGVYELTGG
jgi:hypothetical protein